MGAAWKAVLVDEAAKTYTGTDGRDCTERGTAANWQSGHADNKTKAECIDLCHAKSYFDFTTTKGILDDAGYCYGAELDENDKCRLYKKIVPTTADTGSIPSGGGSSDGDSGKGCW
jgi:hypothetical protein